MGWRTLLVVVVIVAATLVSGCAGTVEAQRTWNASQGSRAADAHGGERVKAKGASAAGEYEEERVSYKVQQ